MHLCAQGEEKCASGKNKDQPCMMFVSLISINITVHFSCALQHRPVLTLVEPDFGPMGKVQQDTDTDVLYYQDNVTNVFGNSGSV